LFPVKGTRNALHIVSINAASHDVTFGENTCCKYDNEKNKR
jgi:hypothetical protein